MLKVYDLTFTLHFDEQLLKQVNYFFHKNLRGFPPQSE